MLSIYFLPSIGSVMPPGTFPPPNPTTSFITAGEIMDRAAILLNDPAKTDYNYAVLMPFLKMALDELAENNIESQSSPLVETSVPIDIPAGTNGLYPQEAEFGQFYPSDLVEIQGIYQRAQGSEDAWMEIPRREHTLLDDKKYDRLQGYSWESLIIKFNHGGATVPLTLQLKYLRTIPMRVLTPDYFVGGMNSRSFLSYKTAAYAAQFIGENAERASILDGKAEQALDRIDNINNKGRQQIMTRHRPFRAAYKMRGGF